MIYIPHFCLCTTTIHYNITIKTKIKVWNYFHAYAFRHITSQMAADEEYEPDTAHDLYILCSLVSNFEITEEKVSLSEKNRQKRSPKPI
jgi:hypothetical protein